MMMLSKVVAVSLLTVSTAGLVAFAATWREDVAVPTDCAPVPARNEPPTPSPLELPKPRPSTKKLGTFRIAAYCPCQKCCGKWALLPASQRPPLRGPYVAADLDLFPKGTRLYIQGVGWKTVSDTGSDIYGKRLDVLMPTHHRARLFGKKWRKVEVHCG